MAQDKVAFAVSLTGRAAKEILTGLELLFGVEKLQPDIRKLVLDKCADLARDQEKILRS